LYFSLLDIYTIAILINDKVGPKMAPICLFTYNRLVETRLTIESLKCNYLAMDSELTIFSDGPKNIDSIKAVQDVRNYLKTITGFKKVSIIESLNNKGLARSVIDGVTVLLDNYSSVIVIEDDLLTSPNFLTYMNKGLDFYESNAEVWSVSGFSFPMDYPQGYEFDAAFGVRASSWGWATWADRWGKVDWDVSDYEVFIKDRKKQKEFNLGGSDLCKMLNDQMTGKINSWAIRFCYSQFKNKTFDVFPMISKVKNIGFSGEATHTTGMGGRFDTMLDETGGVDFEFPERVVVEPRVLSQFQKPFSIQTRIKYKLLGYLK
jgi:hypothetical protein